MIKLLGCKINPKHVQAIGKVVVNGNSVNINILFSGEWISFTKTLYTEDYKSNEEFDAAFAMLVTETKINVGKLIDAIDKE